MSGLISKGTKDSKWGKRLFFVFVILWFFSNEFSVEAQTTAPISPVSVNDQGELGNGWSSDPGISADGRFVVFASSANNLVSGDTNDVADIFVYDRIDERIERISVSSNGDQGNGAASEPSISADGRFVVFASEATNLISRDNNAAIDIFAYDRLTNKVELVSVNNRGEQSNQNSSSPSISGDGRYIAFASLATNLTAEDTNGATDIFIFDLISRHLILASKNEQGQPASGDSHHPLIAANGREIVFASDADNLNTGDNNGFRDIFLFNRVLGTIQRVSVNSNGIQADRWSDFPVISADGNRIAFLSASSNLDAGFTPGASIYLHDGKTGITQRIANPEMDSIFSISADGQILAYLVPSKDAGFDILRKNLITGQEDLIDTLSGELSGTSALSQDGNMIAFDATSSTWQERQVYVWDEDGELLPVFTLAGRVTDSTGLPLSLVAIQDDRGNTVKTDGEGYFWINAVRPGSVTLIPSKEGFRFEPKEIQINVQSDINDLTFTYTHDEVLKEAQLDLGMPYSFDRGAVGHFHGHAAGYCTDLILDAYTWGVDFNIDFALEQDFKAHPWHFYRWRDARNAHDMWRYFSYTGQMLPNDAAYQPGDIVFFDWSEDGEIDHVSIVSEVTSTQNPRKLYDATGVTEGNPGGLAAELPWEYFHERTVRGHARWSGKYEPITPELPTGQNLQMALSGSGAEIRLLDLNGNALSLHENEIPGGFMDDWIWEQTFSVTDSFSEGSIYLVVVSNPGESEIPYQFIAQFIETGLVYGRVELKDTLKAGEIARFPLLLELDEDGKTTIQLGNAIRRIEGTISLTHP